MYGQIQWCMRHGHDWHVISKFGDNGLWLECQVCGAQQKRLFAWMNGWNKHTE